MIRKLSSSPYLLVVAGSISRTSTARLAELLASHLYMRSNGNANLGTLVRYAVFEEVSECAAAATSATPAVFAGIIADKDIRLVVFSSLGSWMTGGRAREGAADEE
jgi:hypothetical protein